MALFNMHYDRPGPGVSPEAPRKKGFARLIELLARDAGAYFKAGLLALLGALPFIICIWLAIASHATIFILVAGILGGMLAMPQLCGMADTVLRSLRDEPGYWWYTYRRSWKRNAKASLLPGALFGLIFAGQIFILFNLEAFDPNLVFLILMLLGIFLSIGLFAYVLAQLALVELDFFTMLKNAALLFLGNLPRSAGACAASMLYWGLVLLYFPLSLVIFVFANFWVPLFISLFFIYAPFEKAFHIEAAIEAQRNTQSQDKSADNAKNS